MAELAQQIVDFNAQLSQIREAHGSAWAVFLDQKVWGAFPDFGEAAEFAFSTLPDANFIIRHTYEKPEFVPFILVE